MANRYFSRKIVGRIIDIVTEKGEYAVKLDTSVYIFEMIAVVLHDTIDERCMKDYRIQYISNDECLELKVLFDKK